jgi:hypothetical protein
MTRRTNPKAQLRDNAISVTARNKSCTPPQESFLLIFRSLRKVATMKMFKTIEVQATTPVGVL